MPVKGWTYYDTISVKWQGQVVATRREKRKNTTILTRADSIDNEEVSVGAMDVTRMPERSAKSIEKQEEKADSEKSNERKSGESTENRKGNATLGKSDTKEKESKKENNKKQN